MKLYVARHGQSLSNKVGVMAGGEDDSPLTEQGLHDAAMLAQRLGTFRGLIVSSPMHRALQTAEYVRDTLLPGAPIRIDPDFAERNMGSATDKPRDEYFSMEQFGLPIAGAETPGHLYERVHHGLVTIRQSNQNTLLVAHGEVYRMLVCVLQGLPPTAYTTIPGLMNGEVKKFDL